MGENRIKELRKQKGLTQVELAKALNVSKGAVAMWETGQRTPTFEYLRPMSMLFNKNPDYILCYSDDASPISWAKPDQTLEQTAEQVLWLKTGDLLQTVRGILLSVPYRRNPGWFPTAVSSAVPSRFCYKRCNTGCCNNPVCWRIDPGS